jgi:hypothetical protein
MAPTEQADWLAAWSIRVNMAGILPLGFRVRGMPGIHWGFVPKFSCRQASFQGDGDLESIAS